MSKHNLKQKFPMKPYNKLDEGCGKCRKKRTFQFLRLKYFKVDLHTCFLARAAELSWQYVCIKIQWYAAKKKVDGNISCFSVPGLMFQILFLTKKYIVTLFLISFAELTL
jgi:hypothetical protein